MSSMVLRDASASKKVKKWLMREGLQFFRSVAESDESDVENYDEWWWVLMRVMMRGSGWLARRAPNNPFSCWHSMDDTLSSADNLYTCHLFTDLLIILIICHCPFFLIIFVFFWSFLLLCHCPCFWKCDFCHFVTAHISNNLLLSISLIITTKVGQHWLK